MNKDQQLKHMENYMTKLYEDMYSDTYIIAKAWQNRTAYISITDITDLLKEIKSKDVGK